MSAKYDAIIWDWNGTLLNDVVLVLQIMNRLLDDHGYPRIEREHYMQVFDFPVRGYYQQIGFDLQTHDFQVLSDRFCTEFEDQLHTATLFPEARATLTRLAGFRQFVLSNTEQATLHRMLAAFGLDSVFESAHGLQDNLASGKSGIGQTLLRSQNVDPSKTVLIGDTTHDAEVAASLQVDCVLIATGHNSHERLAATGCPVVGSLSEIHSKLSDY